MPLKKWQYVTAATTFWYDMAGRAYFFGYADDKTQRQDAHYQCVQKQANNTDQIPRVLQTL